MTGPENLILDRDLNSAGKSPVLVLLHGIMGYAMNWRRVAKEFESAMPVLAYDSRGHGRSQHADLTRFLKHMHQKIWLKIYAKSWMTLKLIKRS